MHPPRCSVKHRSCHIPDSITVTTGAGRGSSPAGEWRAAQRAAGAAAQNKMRALLSAKTSALLASGRRRGDGRAPAAPLENAKAGRATAGDKAQLKGYVYTHRCDGRPIAPLS